MRTNMEFNANGGGAANGAKIYTKTDQKSMPKLAAKTMVEITKKMFL